APGLVRIERRLAGNACGWAGPEPLALQVRIFRVIERAGAVTRHDQRRHNGSRTDQAAGNHAVLPVITATIHRLRGQAEGRHGRGAKPGQYPFSGYCETLSRVVGAKSRIARSEFRGYADAR